MEGQTGGRSKPFFYALDLALTALFYTLRFLFRLLPPSLLYSGVRAMGYLSFRLMPGMRRRLTGKIAEALPEVADSGEIERIGKGACAAFLLPILDMFLLEFYGDRFMRELEVVGMENLDKADAAGKGVVITGTHSGWIAVVHSVLHRLGRTYTPIMFNPSDTPIPHYEWELALQGFFLGTDPEKPVFWAGKDTVKKALEHLGQGKRVGLTFDVAGQGVVDFFGRPAALASGIAYFSYKSGAPIVPVSITRGKTLFDNRLVFHEPIFPDQGAERQAEMARLLQLAASVGEKDIRENPEQWMNWFGLWHWWGEAEKMAQAAAGGGG